MQGVERDSDTGQRKRTEDIKDKDEACRGSQPRRFHSRPIQRPLCISRTETVAETGRDSEGLECRGEINIVLVFLDRDPRGCWKHRRKMVDARDLLLCLSLQVYCSCAGLLSLCCETCIAEHSTSCAESVSGLDEVRKEKKDKKNVEKEKENEKEGEKEKKKGNMIYVLRSMPSSQHQHSIMPAAQARSVDQPVYCSVRGRVARQSIGRRCCLGRVVRDGEKDPGRSAGDDIIECCLTWCF